MKIICSWCGKFYGEKEPLNDPTETNGKCSDCLEKQKEKIEAGEQQIEDGFRILARIIAKAYLEDRRRANQIK